MPTRAKPATPPDEPRRSRWAVLAAAAMIGLGLLGVVASIGGPQDFFGGLAAALYTLIRAGTPAAAYLLGAIGLGRLFLPLIRGAPEAPALQVGLGLGAMLSLSHLLGCLGLFSGSTGMPVALGVVGVGLGLLAFQIGPRLSDQAALSRMSVPWPVLLAAPAVAVMLVAACSPPGWLWETEARGYDALSYHLQLPQEWIALGRLRPLEHNVYSFHPGYIESAFYHLGVMTGSPALPPARGAGMGLLAGEGMGVLACQLLHAGIAIIGAALVGRAVVAAMRSGEDGSGATDKDSRAAIGASLAGVLFLVTPWTVVTGSLAYNDLGVAALMAAALVAATDHALTPARRGVVCGLLVALACGCKATALFMAGPAVGLVLLGSAPPRQWARIILCGGLAGLAALSPWMIRNWIYSGNPVFPAATSVFGTAHWTAEQVGRFAAGHTFGGSIVDRIGLLVGNMEPGSRGMLHAQWALFFPVCLLAAAVLLVRRRHRRIGTLLLAGLGAQALAWLFLTHLQSRFLIPLAVPGCILFGMAASRTPPGDGRLALVAGNLFKSRWLAPLLAPLICIAQAGVTVAIFARQNDGRPNLQLLSGPGILTGEAVPAQMRSQVLPDVGPELFINFSAPPGAVVYLLGDATPLYSTTPVRYNTTWDRWPLGEAMRAAPGDPAAWAAALRAKGITHILANFSEIARLNQSHWADPAVTPESAAAWLDSSARLIRAWPERGSALYELAPPGPAAGSLVPLSPTAAPPEPPR